jgi:hypothetical protein
MKLASMSISFDLPPPMRADRTTISSMLRAPALQ